MTDKEKLVEATIDNLKQTKLKWYDKYINKKFKIKCGKEYKVYTFEGVATNPDTKSGMPLQYVFDGPDNLILDYKEAKEIFSNGEV